MPKLNIFEVIYLDRLSELEIRLTILYILLTTLYIFQIDFEGWARDVNGANYPSKERVSPQELAQLYSALEALAKVHRLDCNKVYLAVF